MRTGAKPILMILASLAAYPAHAGESAASPYRLAIVVDFGDYPTAEAAANSQDSVDWYDDDGRDDTICTVAFAATELRRYLCKITGKDLGDPDAVPIIDDGKALNDRGLNRLNGDYIVVGHNALSAQFDTKPETMKDLPGEGVSGGFRIQTIEAGGTNRLLLLGNDRVGTLYAVYEFLERLGCRWYGPGVVNEEIPHNLPTPLPPMEVTDWPRFRTRGFWAWEDRGNPDFFDWMARNRMNLWTAAQSGIPELRKRGILLTCGGHQHHERFLNPAAPYPYNHPKFKGDEHRPADPYPVGDMYRGDVSGDGILATGEAHPEWYGLRGGKRATELSAGVNFCTSNRDAVAEMMGNLVDDLIHGQWRYADSVNFWTLDVGRWCECDNCKALGTPTDRNLLLVHALRNEIKRAMREKRLHRNVQVAFLAYADVIEPPTRPLPKDFDYENCVATFFPIVRCYAHKFDEPTCTEYNTRYQKNFRGWAIDPERHYRGQIFIGEYYNVSGYKNLPVLYYRTMPHDIRYFYEHGARHMHYMHAPTGNWGPRTLTNYMLAKLLWNPQVDTDALLSDYFRERYSGAAGHTQRFYDSLEFALKNVSVLKYDLGRKLGRGSTDLFSKRHLSRDDFREVVQHIRDARRHIEVAQSLVMKVNMAERFAKRIHEDERLFAYAENSILFYDALIRTREAIDADKTDEAKAALKDAQLYAERLRADTESTKWASSHANARDGLEASYAAPALDRLRKTLSRN